MKTSVIFMIIGLMMCAGTAKPGGIKSTNINISAPGQLSGKIIESGSGLPLKNVSIVLFAISDSSLVVGTISDQIGYFSISMIDTGRYYLEINHPEFIMNHIYPLNVTWESGKIYLDEIHLNPVNRGMQNKADKSANNLRIRTKDNVYSTGFSDNTGSEKFVKKGQKNTAGFKGGATF